MKRIDRLTPEQQARFGEWTKKWVDIGLSTEPADFDTATEAALKAYKLCNLDKPMVVLRMSSPYAATIGGALAWSMLRDMKVKKVWDQVWDQVGAQVWDQVGAQVWAQVGDQVRDQVGDQVRAQVRDQVGDQVGDQVWAQVWDQVGDQVRAQVRDQVGDQVRDQVGDQVRAQVGAQVRAQVWDQVGAQVGAQVGDQVWAQVWDQVGDQVRAQVGAQVRAQVWDQVGAQVGAQVGDQVWASSFAAAKDGYNNYGINNLWWSDFAAWVTYFRDVCGWENEVLEKFEITERLVKSCGWTWWHQNVLAISDRPSLINRDVNGRLHCENGPSIAYRDGWSLYHWHGVSIPKEWVTGSKPGAKDALTWANIEQRRAACEIVGWANVLAQLNARSIDLDNDPAVGELLEADIPDSGKERFLKVRCGTGREFVLPVPREIETALQGNLWTYGIDANDRSFIPEIRT
jgi:hypothetical protein